MPGSTPTCSGCGGETVLRIDPEPPPDATPAPLLADPPFHFVCTSSDCCLAGPLPG